ncbi:putative mitochondrial asparaginyl-tRNA synthetase precursor [Podospora australis]|uniref:asparagine--tRNA ligase n=1 Tax=Podospora australis TaxID=1536484 RepID=A0AAN6X2V6_9PEZI|nr:putative mitochondrial asparaginyl-tRNA synthetase precursor [Podospora australis]
MRPAVLGRALRPSSRVVSRLSSSASSPSRVCRRCVSGQAVAEPKAVANSKINRPISELLQWKPTEQVDDVVVNGFVRSVRGMKAHRFVSLGDGSSLVPLQAVVQTDQAEGLTVGAAVRLTGSWVTSPGAAQSHELHVKEVRVLGPSDASTFPIQKKYQTPEYLRTMPHLRPRTPLNAVLLRLRSEAIASLTQFFAGRSFVQTHPPIITSSDCEGAGEVFTVTPANDTVSQQDAKDSFFKSKKYLTVSTQLHLEALAQSVGNVWTLSPVFRAEQSDTSRHLSEFYMLEAEMSFVDDMAPVMDLAEDMLRHMATNLYKSATVQELLSRSQHIGSDLAPADEVSRRWEGLMQQDWPRMTYTEAIKLLGQHADRFVHQPTWGAGLQSEHEKYLAEIVGEGRRPVFITNYPRDIKAFYMRPTQVPGSVPENTSQATVDCFDLLVPELCEIAGGSMRESRLEPLLEVMTRQGIIKSPADAASGNASGSGLDWYVDLRRWGCPPHGGFGVGFDRLLSYLSGVQTVRDIVSFPRWYGRCDC